MYRLRNQVFHVGGYSATSDLEGNDGNLKQNLKLYISAEMDIGTTHTPESPFPWTVQSGTPIYLTKNGYGTMVVMSLEQYTALTEDIEAKLDEADDYAKEHSERFTAEEVFSRVKQRIQNHEEL